MLVLQLYIDWFFGFVCVILEPAQQERTRCASVGDEKQYTHYISQVSGVCVSVCVCVRARARAPACLHVYGYGIYVYECVHVYLHV